MIKEWITKLKVGDEVIVIDFRGRRTISRVEKVNKTTVKVDGYLFKLDGTERNGRWYTSLIEECTKERRKEVAGEEEKRRYVLHFRKKVWENESLEKLRELYKIESL